MRKRTFGINIRVSEKEKNRIMRNAKKCRLGVSEYLRQLANGYAPRELPNKRMHDLCWQIELLMDEYRENDDEKFKSYLAGILNDLQKVCNGTQTLTETEVYLSESPQSLLCREKEQPRSDKPFDACNESDERSVM